MLYNQRRSVFLDGRVLFCFRTENSTNVAAKKHCYIKKNVQYYSDFGIVFPLFRRNNNFNCTCLEHACL